MPIAWTMVAFAVPVSLAAWASIDAKPVMPMAIDPRAIVQMRFANFMTYLQKNSFCFNCSRPVLPVLLALTWTLEIDDGPYWATQIPCHEIFCFVSQIIRLKTFPI
jgi:hypothetical protein